VDRASLRCAEETLQFLWKSDTVSSKAVILVGNKTDLVRSRTVTTEGKSQGQTNLQEISMSKGKAARHMSVNFPKWTIKQSLPDRKLL
jgi:tRNA U34 5-carboxymethylaminomethyl modifying GTPase MnmE/TrmE